MTSIKNNDNDSEAKAEDITFITDCGISFHCRIAICELGEYTWEIDMQSPESSNFTFRSCCSYPSIGPCYSEMLAEVDTASKLLETEYVLDNSQEKLDYP